MGGGTLAAGRSIKVHENNSKTLEYISTIYHNNHSHRSSLCRYHWGACNIGEQNQIIQEKDLHFQEGEAILGCLVRVRQMQARVLSMSFFSLVHVGL